MENLISRISQYHLFNNFFPGILFGTLISTVFELDISNINIVTLFFIYYFIGMVIARFGSLFIEPISKACGMQWREKELFVKAEKKDQKISTLLQDLNTYRTIASLSLISLVVITINQLTAQDISCTLFTITFVAMTCIFMLFLASYWRQSKQIAGRIDAALKK